MQRGKKKTIEWILVVVMGFAGAFAVLSIALNVWWHDRFAEPELFGGCYHYTQLVLWPWYDPLPEATKDWGKRVTIFSHDVMFRPLLLNWTRMQIYGAGSWQTDAWKLGEYYPEYSCYY